MPDNELLRIAPAGSDRVLTPEQKRFNTLTRQIEQARTVLKAWKDNIGPYAQKHVSQLLPMEDELFEALRQRAFTLDALAARRSWTRAERETLSELACEAAGELLAGDPDDAQLKAVFDRHSELGFDEMRQAELQLMKGLTEAVTGVDLGDAADIASEDDLWQRLHQKRKAQANEREAQANAAEARREEKTSCRRKTAAQQRREDEERQATQSLREVFRKLASALHPDRETDPGERAAKTVLMQEVNQAYANGDLLALLELQLRIEQIDATHMANLDTRRLKHYIKVLAEQLDELRKETLRVEAEFRMDFGLERGWGLNPLKLGNLLQRELRSLRAELAQARQQARVFEDPPATKRWLKAERHRLREADFELDFF